MSIAAQHKLAILLTLALSSCERDDPIKLQNGYAYCIKFAEQIIHKDHPNATISFGAVQNTSSDPTPNAFEFVWARRDISSEPIVSDLWVVCSGNAQDREITEMNVRGTMIKNVPLKF